MSACRIHRFGSVLYHKKWTEDVYVGQRNRFFDCFNLRSDWYIFSICDATFCNNRKLRIDLQLYVNIHKECLHWDMDF